ncbi:MAG: hypothetical protein WCR02_03020 [Sphaerochaetaceae bacterium]
MRERKKLNGGDNLVGYVFISPWLLGFLLFSLIPMLASLYYAFCDYDILGSPVFCGGANFVKMMHDKLF